MKQGPASKEHRAQEPLPKPRHKVPYIVSRFPNLTQTLVLQEMLATEEQGVESDLYPLLCRRATVVQPEGAVPAGNSPIGQ